MMTEGSGETAMCSSGRWTHAHKKKFISLNLLISFQRSSLHFQMPEKQLNLHVPLKFQYKLFKLELLLSIRMPRLMLPRLHISPSAF